MVLERGGGEFMNESIRSPANAVVGASYDVVRRGSKKSIRVLSYTFKIKRKNVV